MQIFIFHKYCIWKCWNWFFGGFLVSIPSCSSLFALLTETWLIVLFFNIYSRQLIQTVFLNIPASQVFGVGWNLLFLILSQVEYVVNAFWKICFTSLMLVFKRNISMVYSYCFQEMIDEADRNGDGEVDEDEFLRIMKKTSLYWCQFKSLDISSKVPDAFCFSLLLGYFGVCRVICLYTGRNISQQA